MAGRHLVAAARSVREAVVDAADSIGTDEATSRARAFASLFDTEDAFRAFYERSLPRIYGYLYPRTGADRAAAEELTQLTFVEAVRARHTYDGRADPIVWLTGIARHKLIDHYRARQRDEGRRMRAVVAEIGAAGEHAAWRAADERAAIVAALDRLPALQRAVLVLHYADGLSVREVATAIRKSESATESLMTRAREAFRRAYGEASDG